MANRMESVPKKMKREPNLVQSEKDLVCDLSRKYWNVIQSKKTDGVTVDQKRQAWKKIEEEFNAQSSIHYRTATVLKCCLDNLKKRLKKDHTNARQNAFTTGGGPHQSNDDDPTSSRLKDLLKPNIEGLYNQFDNDAIMGEPSTSNTEVIFNLENEDQNDNANVEQVDACQESTPVSQESFNKVQIIEQDWSFYTPQKLRTPINSALKLSTKKLNPSRRRPALCSEKLSEAKLESLEEVRNQALKEHILKMKIMEEEHLLKKKILEEELKHAKLRTLLLESELKQKS